jgi:transitional endoplasmic reticulum ATPase
MADFDEAFLGFRPAALRFSARVPETHWEDFGGYEDVKRVLLEAVEQPFMYPGLYRRFALHPCTSLLLYGPPGCGKTLLAKVVASQCNLNFISVKGPELLSSHFGESEANVRELFARARQNSPCVVFFDEIDSLCRARGADANAASSTCDRVLTQLLTEMDANNDAFRWSSPSPSSAAPAKDVTNEAAWSRGRDSERLSLSEGLVFVIGATNRPDVLDAALLRVGRMDKLVYVGLPDAEARVGVLRAAIRKTPLSADITEAFLRTVAEQCVGFSSADLAAVVSVARAAAVRECIAAAQTMNSNARGGAMARGQLAAAAGPDALQRRHLEEALGSARRSVSQARHTSFTQTCSTGVFASICLSRGRERHRERKNVCV